MKKLLTVLKMDREADQAARLDGPAQKVTADGRGTIHAMDEGV
jgi:hypothetical protein